jgi:hypothetical protein
VDLNRNFLLPREAYTDASEAYAALNNFLNPAYPPRLADFYILKELWLIWRMGFGPLKQAVAEGQFAFPKGIFFGGHKPAQSTVILQNNIRSWIRGARVVHLDFHTGLGKGARYKLLVPKQRSHRLGQYSAIFGAEKVEVIGSDAGMAYEVRGDLGRYLTATIGEDYHLLFAEFGTYPGLQVLRALRKENQAHFYASETSVARRRSKAELLEAFCPASPR